ncbi:hypothetical protein GBA52_013321 [Prunus armeniaca]|nr:hypothetical protein GBA52_013321 [Prunus armeniaca]
MENPMRRPSTRQRFGSTTTTPRPLPATSCLLPAPLAILSTFWTFCHEFFYKGMACSRLINTL